jgi:hypothetical protein
VTLLAGFTIVSRRLAWQVLGQHVDHAAHRYVTTADAAASDVDRAWGPSGTVGVNVRVREGGENCCGEAAGCRGTAVA